VSRKRISVVVPVYHSEQILREFHRRLTAVLDGLDPAMDREIVFVNDASPDDSLSVLRELAAKDSAVRVLDLSRNFGHQVAITAGLDDARGDVVVVIDDDLQDPPEVIVEMLAKWREGYKVVYGQRTKRKGENAFKRGTAALFYRLLGRLSDVDLPVDAGDFRLMDRQVVEAVKAMREESRYMRGMVAWIGFKQCGLRYERDARYAGEGHYTLSRLMELAVAGILSFSSKPLELSTRLGLATTMLAFVAGVYVIVNKILHPESVLSGWASVLIAVLFMGGVQLVSIGVLGSYIGRVFYETKRRPLYFVNERIGERAGEAAGE
jgi:glycosyltransferase involved in cell wall biosynthesis